MAPRSSSGLKEYAILGLPSGEGRRRLVRSLGAGRAAGESTPGTARNERQGGAATRRSKPEGEEGRAAGAARPRAPRPDSRRGTAGRPQTTAARAIRNA